MYILVNLEGNVKFLCSINIEFYFRIMLTRHLKGSDFTESGTISIIFSQIQGLKVNH